MLAGCSKKRGMPMQNRPPRFEIQALSPMVCPRLLGTVRPCGCIGTLTTRRCYRRTFARAITAFVLTYRSRYARRELAQVTCQSSSKSASPCPFAGWIRTLAQEGVQLPRVSITAELDARDGVTFAFPLAAVIGLVRAAANPSKADLRITNPNHVDD